MRQWPRRWRAAGNVAARGHGEWRKEWRRRPHAILLGGFYTANKGEEGFSLWTSKAALLMSVINGEWRLRKGKCMEKLTIDGGVLKRSVN